MPSLTTEDYRYFENKLYLPMLITVLERDKETVLKSPFKLGRPYVALFDKALDIVRADLKATDIYLTRRNMRLASEKLPDGVIEYTYIPLATKNAINLRALNCAIRPRCC